MRSAFRASSQLPDSISIRASVTLVGPGTTKIEFQIGDLKTEVPISAEPSANPERIVIEPKNVELGVGTTARFKLFGEYKDGSRADLSDSAYWRPQPQDDRTVYAGGGLVEGMVPGNTTIAAKYRANPDSPYLDATANVSVSNVAFQSIEVGVNPKAVGLGLSGKLRADAVGRRRQAILRPGVVPVEGQRRSALSRVGRGRNLLGERVGSGKLAANFGSNNLGAEAEFKVVVPSPVGPKVHPENLDLVVGEIADITYVSPRRDAIHLSSTKPGVVEITAGNRIIGRAVGDTQIEVMQSGQKIGTVEVTVTQAEFQSVAVDPGNVAVAVDEMMVPRVVAQVKGSDPPRAAGDRPRSGDV